METQVKNAIRALYRIEHKLEAIDGLFKHSSERDDVKIILDTLLSWEKEDMINTVEDYDNNVLGFKQETISIIDEQGKVYEFEKPDFECELYKVRDKFIFGRVNEMPVVISINSGSIKDSDYVNIGKYLTPIKPYYDDEKNYPLYFKKSINGIYCSVGFTFEDRKKTDIEKLKECGFIEITEVEALALVVKGGK